MNVRDASSRRRFLAGAAGTGVLTFAPALTAATGARTGPWCRPLTKFAREHVYDFSLYYLSGEVFQLSELAGRVVWLNFFTSWCPPCNAEAGDIVRIGAKYANALTVVGISVKEQKPPVLAFRKKHDIPYRIALDDTGSVFKALGFDAYPTHMFLDAKGAISCISVGDLTPEQMDNEVAVALDRTSVPGPAPTSDPNPEPSATPP